MVGFAGVGQVFSKDSTFSLNEFKPSAGLGLRLRLVKDQPINLRIDYGWSSDDSSFEFNFMEAF